MKKLIMFLPLFFLISNVLTQSREEWIWSATAGGSNNDWGTGIAIDESGNSYITGTFELTANFGSTSITSNGTKDIFVAKLDPEGNYLWSTHAGGNIGDWAYDISTDNEGNSYVTGVITGTVTFDAITLVSNGGWDIFVAKLDSLGSWEWAINAGGAAADQGLAIATNEEGDSFVTGTFEDNATFGILPFTSNGWDDIFVMKVDTWGNIIWVYQCGGTGSDEGTGITVDDNDNCFFTGSFSDTATFGPTSLTSDGQYDIFISKIDQYGSWQWTNRAGGTDDDYGSCVDLDNSGYCYIGGEFEGTASFGPYSLINSGNWYDIYVAKLDEFGNWEWANSAHGSTPEDCEAIAVDSRGNATITGYFNGTLEFGSIVLTDSDAVTFDGYIAKINNAGTWLWAESFGNTNGEDCNGVVIDNFGSSYITGYFTNTLSIGGAWLNSHGGRDILTAKYGFPPLDNDGTACEPNSLHINSYPNPFCTTNKLTYNVSQTGNVKLEVFNMRGQLVKQLLHDYQTKGEHSLSWDGMDANGKQVPSGLYFYKISLDNAIMTHKVVVLKD